MDFYKGKRVLITGHTGFKGTWMCEVLNMLGAEVIGYALDPPTTPSVYKLCDIDSKIKSYRGDIRDIESLKKVFEVNEPEIVIHMAAQPIVRESYVNPVYTYETNVMGTVNVLEAVRCTKSVRSFINVTTDKVYLNKEWMWGYREFEELNGFDPYSNSKSCSELVTSSYIHSFFTDEVYKARYGEGSMAPAISTCRAGNVIGGGDFAKDRIIPDCVRAVHEKKDIIVRNPHSIRPYQHVLEPIMAYLLIAKLQYFDRKYAGSYNVGPSDDDCWTTGGIVSKFCEKYNSYTDEKTRWVSRGDEGPHEANYLKLDCSKIRNMIGWKPVWNVEQAIEKIVEWTVVYLNDEDVRCVMHKQIEEYLKLFALINGI